MARPTKTSIVDALLLGQSISWTDSNGKKSQQSLANPQERRLFEYLLNSTVRDPKGLPATFIAGLVTAFDATHDPLRSHKASSTMSTAGVQTWRLLSIETEGFGGINTWNGSPFKYEFDRESILIEGPNGSGKSSLVAAVVWALLGERPRDQSIERAEVAAPVFDKGDKITGNWPPIATYPVTSGDLKSQPKVRVALAFQSDAGAIATVERKLENGTVSEKWDPSFVIPRVLLETGMLMPTRIAQVRLKEGGGGLKEAVQSLTGLDELVDLGQLADGLCHAGREYLSYAKNKNLDGIKASFNAELESARKALAPVKLDVPSFTPKETDDENGTFATLKKSLVDNATSLTTVVATDLADGLVLSDATVQKQIVVAIENAKEDVARGLSDLLTWKTLETIQGAVSAEVKENILTGIEKAKGDVVTALDFQARNLGDTRFQLKAVAAQWHVKHGSGAVETCPLCSKNLEKELAEQLEALKISGEAATKQLADNLNSIRANLLALVPPSIRQFSSKFLQLNPRVQLLEDLRNSFASNSRHKLLKRFGAIANAGLAIAPSAEFQVPVSIEFAPEAKELADQIVGLLHAVNASIWFAENNLEWAAWWQKLAGDAQDSVDPMSTAKSLTEEELSVHLGRLSAALGQAEPYRVAAAALENAWKNGVQANAIAKEQAKRQSIADAIAPLKLLGQLANSVTRSAIDGLSSRIGEILNSTYISEKLHFAETKFEKKEGVIVRGEFGGEIRIDATLVANSSWLRAVLWAFVFALRDESVDQLGIDPFPVLMFDDPQATFDLHHRHRWGGYVTALQKRAVPAQVFLTSHDEQFCSQLRLLGLLGRQALVSQAGPELGHIALLEGDELDRRWTLARKQNTPAAGQDYMKAVRIYIEGILKLLLRGEGSDIAKMLLGSLRERLHLRNTAGIPPWNRSEFSNLVGKLGKNLPAIKHIEMSHHTSGQILTMVEAAEVQEYWSKKLRPTLESAFRLARDYHLLHGGQKALHALPPKAILPNGFQPELKASKFKLVGRAAALSNGRVADGQLDLDVQTGTDVAFEKHFVYQLTVPTLEPVARANDLLLVKDDGDPSPNSLVVALSENRILARRFEISVDASDVAVLTAHATNPSEIAQPVVARTGTLTMKQIVGVLFHSVPKSGSVVPGHEVCECLGAAIVSSASKDALLVEVVGHSAVPLALNGQYLILKSAVNADATCKYLDGRPVIAVDNSNEKFFKRLRIMSSNQVVLESLHSGGEYPPLVYSLDPTTPKFLTQLWQVAGVLFELPSKT